MEGVAPSFPLNMFGEVGIYNSGLEKIDIFRIWHMNKGNTVYFCLMTHFDVSLQTTILDTFGYKCTLRAKCSFDIDPSALSIWKATEECHDLISVSAISTQSSNFVKGWSPLRKFLFSSPGFRPMFLNIFGSHKPRVHKTYRSNGWVASNRIPVFAQWFLSSPRGTEGCFELQINGFGQKLSLFRHFFSFF